jgi:lysozyme family protein
LVIAGLVLLIVGLALGGLLNFKDHPEVWAAVSGLIGSVLGYFSANANQVVSFYFGSSAGSAAKTDQLAQHASEALSALGRLTPRPPARPTGAAGASVTRVDSAGGTTTTVATGEPEAQDLVMKAVTASPVRSAQAEQRWDACIAFVLAKEGGFVDNPADAGRATNLGITLNTLAHARGTSVSVDDVRNLTEAEAKQIYQHDYWDLERCDDLPAGVDLCAFDSAVLCGAGTAARFLQTASGMTGNDVDGRVGTITLGAVDSKPARDIIEQMATLREQHHRKRAADDPTQRQFLEGWLNRVQDMRDAALRMAAEQASVPVS